MPQYKSLRAAKQAFSEASMQVVVDLRPTANEHYLLVGLKDEVTSKKTPGKRSMKGCWW